MSNKQGFQLDLGPVIQALKDVDDAVRDTLVKEALTSGAELIEDAVKAEAPVGETGLLQESIGKKVKAIKGSGVGYAVIGPRTDFAGTGPDGKTDVPWRYSHLVELGHIAANGEFIVGNPFIKRATDTTREAALGAVAETLDAGIAAVAGGGS